MEETPSEKVSISRHSFKQSDITNNVDIKKNELHQTIIGESSPVNGSKVIPYIDSNANELRVKVDLFDSTELQKYVNTLPEDKLKSLGLVTPEEILIENKIEETPENTEVNHLLLISEQLEISPDTEDSQKEIVLNIDLNKSKKVCSKCNFELPENAKYCSECGTPQSAKFCIGCGYKFEGKEKFCPECGESR